MKVHFRASFKLSSQICTRRNLKGKNHGKDFKKHFSIDCGDIMHRATGRPAIGGAAQDEETAVFLILCVDIMGR